MGRSDVTRRLTPMPSTLSRLACLRLTSIKTLSTPIVIPEVVRRKAGLPCGDRVGFKVSGGAITISPKTERESKKQSASNRRALNRGLARSEKEHEAGQVLGPFETHEEFVGALRGAVKETRRKKTTRPR